MRHDFFFAAAGASIGYDDDVQALIDARAAAGDPILTAYADAINEYILKLKSVTGLWLAIRQLVVIAGATTVAGARLSLKGNNLTNNNLVDADINIKTGSAGNASNKYWGTGYSGAGPPGTSQNDMHTYIYLTSAGSGSTILYGNGNTVAGVWNQRADGTSRNRSSASDSASGGNAVGGYGANRLSSTAYERMVANTVGTVTRTSGTPPAAAHSVLAGAGGNVPTDARCLVWAIGRGITTLASYTGPTADLVADLAAI